MFAVPTFYRSRFDDLFAEVDRLARQTGGAEVPVSVWSSDDALAATVELPGVAKDDLAIEVTADTLAISGNRPAPAAEGTWISRERGARRFSRTVALPWRVDPDRVDARLVDGVLTVALRRAESDKPRKIAVAV